MKTEFDYQNDFWYKQQVESFKTLSSKEKSLEHNLY